jgi:hypothetical protein
MVVEALEKKMTRQLQELEGAFHGLQESSRIELEQQAARSKAEQDQALRTQREQMEAEAKAAL